MTTGSGKTAIALKLISVLGGPAIILLHRELLLQQWYNEIKKWLNVSEFDIGVVKQDSFGGHKLIVLASIQTLLSRLYVEDFYNRFATLVVDEVHHIAAEVFAKVVPMFNVTYKIGLLGQPRRSDGMDGVYLNEVGDVIYRDSSNIFSGEFYILKSDSVLSDKLYRVKTSEGWKISIAKLINLICRDYKFREDIVRLLKVLLKQGRKVVVLSHRVEFCKFLYLSLKPFCESLGKLIGIAVSEEKQDVSNCDLVVSTYQMLSEGIDLKVQDTLVLATPSANLTQAVGRIMRGEKDKVTFIDIKFNVPDIDYWYVNHAKFAAYRNWQVINGNLKDLQLFDGQGKNNIIKEQCYG
jgi:hypothetical protein